jgi:hypothetical protein
MCNKGAGPGQKHWCLPAVTILWVHEDVYPADFSFFFSYRLYELNVEDANEIDWEDLAGAIG